MTASDENRGHGGGAEASNDASDGVGASAPPPPDPMAKAVDAARYGSLDKLRCLMEEAPVAARIAPNQKDREDITMLHWAAINNRLLVVRYLLSQGADPRLPGGVLKETALQWAARQGHLEVVMELLRVGTDPQHPNV
eukprot:Partr_v1_DN38123_c0_g1_i1_m1501 putative Zinc finger, DHHC-type containing